MIARHIQTIEALAGFNTVQLGCQVLGWLGAGVLGRHHNHNVPILCISGPTESNKSLLQGLLHYHTVNPELGYRLNYDMRQKLLQRSPGVTYAFTSNSGHDDLYNVKLETPYCRFQRIPSRSDVLELLEWLKSLAERCSIGSEDENVELIYPGYRFIIAAVRSVGAVELALELDRHAHFLKET